MKISSETFEVMQNMSQIHNGIVVDEENVLKTMSTSGSVICVFDTDESFPLFAIWDFTKFNSLIAVHGIENCEFSFDEKEEFIEILSGSRKSKYEYADAGTMPVFEQIKDSKAYKAFNKFDFEFTITEDDIKDIKKVNNIFGFSEDVLKITMNDGVGTLEIFSEENETGSNFTLEIDGEGTGEAITKVEDLCMIQTDYVASVNEQMIRYQAKDKPLMYFIRTYLTDK